MKKYNQKKGSVIHITLPIEVVPSLIHLLVLTLCLTYNAGKSNK
jgi:hypothetical protein